MNEDTPSAKLPGFLKDSFKAQESEIGVVFLEAPPRATNSSWQIFNQRLKTLFSFSSKTGKEILPIICPPLEKTHHEWLHFLEASLWPWDEKNAVIRSDLKKNCEKRDSTFYSFFHKRRSVNSHKRKVSQLIGFFTSGSTGKPKIILHHKTSLEQSAKVSGKVLNLENHNQRVLFSSLPFFHVGGFLTGLRSKIFNCPLYWRESYQFTEGLLELEEKDIVVVGVPSQIELIKSISSKLQIEGKRITFYAGGDKVKEDHWITLKDLGRLLSTYGQSESCGAIVYQDGISGESKTFEDVKISINKEGLLSYKTSRLALATLTLLDDSEKDILTLQIEEHNPDGYFETQDLVREVTLENGVKQLHILGRADGLFQCGGEMISPKELENKFRNLLLTQKKISSFQDRLQHFSLQGMPDSKLGKIPVLFLKGLKLDEIKELAKLLAPHNKGPKKIRAMAVYPEIKGIKPSIDEFQESYHRQSINI